MFVFKDESEATTAAEFPNTQWDNFGRSLFLLSLLLPVVCTHTTRAKRFRKKQRDFFTRQTRSISSNSTTTREREREKKRDEKKNTNRERSNRVRLPGPPLSISRHKNYKCYSLLSLTDKPAGAGDANLQLLLRPVRLGAVDPSQGVLLARGVRSFRISHILLVYLFGVVGCVCSGDEERG